MMHLLMTYAGILTVFLHIPLCISSVPIDTSGTDGTIHCIRTSAGKVDFFTAGRTKVAVHTEWFQYYGTALSFTDGF